MKILVDGEVGWDLFELTRLFRAIDGVLAELDEEVDRKEQARDTMEYWCGVGFVACQKYISGVSSAYALSRKQALDLGPTSNSGTTVVSTINAAANLWKHSDEWSDDIEPLNPRASHAAEIIFSTLPADAWEYRLCNTLHSLVGQVRFLGLLTVLEAWREAVSTAS